MHNNNSNQILFSIINKYATKFSENVVNVLNNYTNEILKLKKNYYILIDGIDELLLYDQYLKGEDVTVTQGLKQMPP